MSDEQSAQDTINVKKDIMSRYFRFTYQLQRNYRTIASLKYPSVLYRNGHGILIDNVVPLSSQINYFSVKTPTVLHRDEEKFSDSDSESDEERRPNDILETVIKNGKPLSSEEWEGVKSEAYRTLRHLNSYTVDAVVMSICCKLKQLSVGLSYIDHLSQIKMKPNVATVQQFLRLCFYCKETTVNEQLILSMYDELRAKYPILDASTCESVILALSLTTRWKEGLDLLEMAKLTCHPGGLEYGVLTKAAFDNNEINISKNLIEEMLQIGRQLRPEVYHAWLDYLDRLCNGDKQYRWRLVEETLKILVDNDLKPTIDVIEKMKLWFEEAGTEHKGSLSTITERSQDDPFLLYAALYSGLGTYFVSKDLMRTHSYLLQNSALRSTFRNWRLQHQYQIKYITQTGKVHLKFPLAFNPMAQKNRDGAWHVPYELEFFANPAQVMDAPTLWLCLNTHNSSRAPRNDHIY
ncbi:hypothetical protein C0J52_05155 [Blattella germanica]|nr:hypothetical protein C0J52_05155 [Blattella germanica]